MKSILALISLLCLAGWILFFNALNKMRAMKKLIDVQAVKIKELEELHKENERKIKKLEQGVEILNTAWKRLDRLQEILNEKDLNDENTID